EELLDGLADLRLVRVFVHAEGVLADGGAGVRLLGDDRCEHDLAGFHYRALPSSTGSAVCETTRERAQTTAPTSSSWASTPARRSRWRNERASATSSGVQTSTTGRVRCETIAAACFVDGVSNVPASTSASVPACA